MLLDCSLISDDIPCTSDGITVEIFRFKTGKTIVVTTH